MNVLIVCTGNTCRSPLAAALLSGTLAMNGPPGVQVASAGTDATDGSPASEGAYLVALEAGFDLSGHRARALSPALVRDADLILVMSSRHLARVHELGGSGKAALLGEYATAGRDPQEIQDPFGGGLEGYRETMAQLGPLMEGVRQRLAGLAGHDRG